MKEVLIPLLAATRGEGESRTAAELPLIEGRPWLEVVLETLPRGDDVRHTVLLPQSCQRSFFLADMISLVLPDADVILTPDDVHGLACTLLFASDRMTYDELAIVPGNQLYRGDLSLLLARLADSPWQVTLATFESLLPRWPHVRQSASGDVLEASAVGILSRHAFSGIAHFRHGVDFLRAAEESLLKGADDQRYELPQVINEVILAGQAVGALAIEAADLLPLVTESDFAAAARTPQSMRILRA